MIYDEEKPCKVGICKSDGTIAFVLDTSEECSLNCTNGMEWNPCGCNHTCTTMGTPCDFSSCEPGCYCPVEMVWDGEQCIPQHQCSCTHTNGTLMEEGQTWDEGCSRCKCKMGVMNCFEVRLSVFCLCIFTLCPF